MVSFVLLLLISVQIGLVMSDLPIHCLHWQVKGKWHLEFTDFQPDPNNCGYDAPNQNDYNLNNYNYKFLATDSMHVHLKTSQVESAGENAFVSTNEVHRSGQVMGDWTMVYDEGFQVELDTADNSRTRFFAFMDYEPHANLHYYSDSVNDYTSHCDRTRVGWVTKTNHDGSEILYGCGKAVQTHVEHGESLIASLPLTHNIHHKKKSNNRHLGFVSETSYLKDDEIYQPDYSLVETINNDQTSSWKATVHKQFIGKTMKEMYALLGRNRFNSISPASKIRSQKVAVEPAPINMLDLNMSNYQETSKNWVTSGHVNPVRNQGSCGSCYAMASTDAFSSRYSVLTGKAITISPQDILSCSNHNQGCEGGYPFLVAKFGQEVGFFPEHCNTYTAHDSHTCQQQCSQADRIKLKSYNYVGGYYGNCNAVRMIEELKNGPIVVAFDARRDLFHYSSGIYHCEGSLHSEQQKEAFPDGNTVREWEKTTHAVVCVGYGSEMINGHEEKYWLIKNSWGNDWGEDGYFRIRRGGNTCGIESMAVSGSF